MNILSNIITQIILVHFKEIPLLRLSHRKTLERFSKKFEFNSVDVVQDPNENVVAVQCRNGIYKDLDGNEISIQRLTIEERKILYMILGTSEQADHFYNQLTKYLFQLSTTKVDSFMKPIIKSEESEITCQLDFSAERLFPQRLVSFVNDNLPKEAESEYANALIQPWGISFQMDFRAKDNSLNDYRISLARKEFVLSPEVGYGLTEKVFYSKAPFDTFTHIKLLSKLEDTLKK